ncbi:MAG: ribosomal RNA small subunit methyltransferase A [Deltaproteobacteria bacterium]|nr:ribosomal RNA small subunit methyltransferase A [Deltaproteobacteria bacterium]
MKRGIAKNRWGHLPRKRLGQHFLVDRNAMEKLVAVADLGPEDVVLEIGPGRGEMTLLLARRSRRVVAVEIDESLVGPLKAKTAPLGNVTVIHGDALKVDLEEVCRSSGRRVKIVANLPYQISTPLLRRFIGLRHLISSMVLMLQKEVALRIVAKPRTRQYGALSVFLQLYTTPSIEMVLPPRCFFPRPKVDSALVRFSVNRAPRVEIHDERSFERVVRVSFGHRRKTLKNALRTILPSDLFTCKIEKLMEEVGIDPGRRAETMSLDDFARLTDGLIPYLLPEGQ